MAYWARILPGRYQRTIQGAHGTPNKIGKLKMAPKPAHQSTMGV